MNYQFTNDEVQVLAKVFQWPAQVTIGDSLSVSAKRFGITGKLTFVVSARPDGLLDARIAAIMAGPFNVATNYTRGLAVSTILKLAAPFPHLIRIQRNGTDLAIGVDNVHFTGIQIAGGSASFDFDHTL